MNTMGEREKKRNLYDVDVWTVGDTLEDEQQHIVCFAFSHSLSLFIHIYIQLVVDNRHSNAVGG